MNGHTPATATVETHEVKTIRVFLPDNVIDDIRDADQVYVVLASGALNREMTPIRLSYSAVQRLTRDS